MQKLTNLEKVKNIFLQKVRQCHYCNNQKLQKHISCCSGKAGFEFSFDNGKLIDYQDHYSNLGDIPFSVYYNFETTTGSMFFCLFVCLFGFLLLFFLMLWATVLSLNFIHLLNYHELVYLEVLIKIKMILNLSHIFKLLNTNFLILKKNILTEPP